MEKTWRLVAKNDLAKKALSDGLYFISRFNYFAGRYYDGNLIKINFRGEQEWGIIDKNGNELPMDKFISEYIPDIKAYYPFEFNEEFKYDKAKPLVEIDFEGMCIEFCEFNYTGYLDSGELFFKLYIKNNSVNLLKEYFKDYFEREIVYEKIHKDKELFMLNEGYTKKAREEKFNKIIAMYKVSDTEYIIEEYHEHWQKSHGNFVGYTSFFTKDYDNKPFHLKLGEGVELRSIPGRTVYEDIRKCIIDIIVRRQYDTREMIDKLYEEKVLFEKVDRRVRLLIDEFNSVKDELNVSDENIENIINSIKDNLLSGRRLLKKYDI